MKKDWLTFLLITIISPVICRAQYNTVYYDYNAKRTTDIKESIDYCVYHAEGDNNFSGKKYSVRDNKLESIGYYSSIDPIVEDGHFTIYENGDISSEGNYARNKKQGKWIYYRNGTKDKWYTETYISDSKIKLRSYYPDNRLKRKEKHNDTYTKAFGKCYNEKGKKIPFTKFYTAPVPSVPIDQYLSENLKYPRGARDSSIDGTVILKYVVNEDGNVTNTEVVKGIGGGCNEEAVHVISQMPAWSPAIKDDGKIKVTFYQQVRFDIE